MSIKILIPTWRNPYEVQLNNQKYSYKAGKFADVPEDVAAIIQVDIDAHTAATAEPALTQPRWGKQTKKVTKSVWYQSEGNWDEAYETYAPCYMTKEEFDTLVNSETFEGYTIYADWIEIDAEAGSGYVEETLTPFQPSELAYNEAGGYAYIPDFNDNSGYGDYWKASYIAEVTEVSYEPIPQEYLAEM